MNPDALDAPLKPLDTLPRGLWLPGIINGVGGLVGRIHALSALREQLLAGALPSTQHWGWPAGPLLAAFHAACEELELATYCTHNEDVTDQVLRSLLWHVDRIAGFLDRGESEAEAIAHAVDAFREDWSHRTGEMDELIYVFGELGDLLKNNRSDLTRGLLKSESWQEIVRIRRLLETLPELAAAIRRLGRSEYGEDFDQSQTAMLQTTEQIVALASRTRETRVPEVPAETRGVFRSGRVARMLPSESVLLNHPRLRLVWHARHAERTLMSYEEDDRQVETVHDLAPKPVPVPQRLPARRLEKGPLIVCVDTSGSMQGACEQVAKAVVLEAMRTAHAQRRPCYVYAFGGPEELLERELSLDPQGLANLSEFLGLSFHGGTDVDAPLERAVAKLGEARWRLADVLLATDGEFGATPAFADKVREARETLGLRVQGILIGDRETIGLLELSDDIFWVHDWRRFGAAAERGGQTETVVHTKSLTANYFPGALRSPEVKAGTVHASDASKVVLSGTGTKPR